jgi:hypothetical protein
MKRLGLVALVATLLISPSPAQAVPDVWVRWTSPDFSTHPDARNKWVRALEFTLPGTVYAGTEGNGVFRTVNNGVTWTEQNSGLTGAAQDIRAFHTSGTTVLAGTGTGLFKSVSNGAWQPVSQEAGADKMGTRAVQALETSAGQLLAGTASGGVFRSADGGATWSPNPMPGMQAAETVWDIQRHPTLDTRVYAATTRGVYISSDSGATWTISSDGMPFSSVFRIAVDPALPNVVWAGTTSNGVFRSINAGTTWENANGDNIATDLEQSKISSVFVFPGSPPSVFVGTENYVWATSDGGLSWGQMATSGMENPLIRSFAMIPSAPGFFYAGTQAAGVHTIPLQPPTNTALPATDSTPAVGEKLTGTKGTWDGTKPLRFTYQWIACDVNAANCADIPGANETTYVVTAADDTNNKRFKFKVTAFNVVVPINGVAATSGVTNTPTAAPGALPGNTASPVLSPDDGSKRVGQLFSVTNGTWTNAPTSYSYQWARCTDTNTCTPIEGATASTYTAAIPDTTKYLRVDVTATNSSGSGLSAFDITTFQIIRQKPENVVLPAFTGDAYVGSVLDSNTGVWKGEGITYTRTWQRCEEDGLGCNSIINASNPSYTLTAQDKGKRVQLRVEARNGQGSNFATEAFSALTAAVTDPPAPPADPGGGGTTTPGGGTTPPGGGTVTPGPGVVIPITAKPANLVKAVLSGKARVGKKLKVKLGTWSGAPTFKYQWLRNGKKIAKATKATYKLTRKDRRKKISCRITARNAFGTATFTTKAVKVR